MNNYDIYRSLLTHLHIKRMAEFCRLLGIRLWTSALRIQPVKQSGDGVALELQDGGLGFG
jgi:hypothetical protein